MKSLMISQCVMRHRWLYYRMDPTANECCTIVWITNAVRRQIEYKVQQGV